MAVALGIELQVVNVAVYVLMSKLEDNEDDGNNAGLMCSWRRRSPTSSAD